jgi:hypothetical protein
MKKILISVCIVVVGVLGVATPAMATPPMSKAYLWKTGIVILELGTLLGTFFKLWL